MLKLICKINDIDKQNRKNQLILYVANWQMGGKEKTMDIKNIETFLCVAELEHFTRAAAKLGYVQSTVTMQIQQLEQELGFPLFDRIGRKVSLTPLGHSFLPYANEIQHIMQQTFTLGKRPEEMHGTLKIGVMESLTFSTMVDILPVYQKHFPHVTVEIVVGPATDLLTALRQNQLDMIYISSNLNTDPNFRCQYMRKEQIVFVASPHHELVKKGRVSLQCLLQYPFIATERSGICYRRLEEMASANNCMIHNSVIINNIAAIIHMLVRNNSVSFLPQYFVAQYINQGDLSQINIDMGEQYYYSQVLCHKSKWISPFAKDMISLIKETRPEIEVEVPK